MSAHTPGPWEAIEFDVVRSDGPKQDRTIAFGALFRSESADEVKANARLIAVAPDLFDAMKVILEGFEKGIFVRNIDHDHEPMWALGIAVQIAALAKGQQAIAKAEGR